MRSLSYYQIDISYLIYELLINSLVYNNRFYQLHQFIQFHVITDSAPIACQLLALEKLYPPAGQLALDMFKRLGYLNSNIIDVLLSRYQVRF